jgi:AMP-binding enzyme/AMP-binding enzyme C-terminal domain
VRAVDAVLTARPDLDAHCLTVIVYGWAALPPATLASLKRHCGEDLCAFEIFGQTESISCHRFWPDEWPELYAATAPQDNYVGVPSPILASTVLDPDGGDLASQPGVAGEAVYRSPAVMAGYYRDEAATRHAFRYGWFHSGDSCAYDDAGLRIMVDRYKDIVKTGGENVSSLRVEAVLAQHPDVAKAAVIGLPHPRWSEAVTAVVVLRGGAQVSEDDLVKYCRANLAGYETPKSVLFVADLPETVGGKVLKYKLRAEHTAHYAAELALAVVAEPFGISRGEFDVLGPQVSSRPAHREQVHGQARVDQQVPDHLGDRDEAVFEAGGGAEPALQPSRLGGPAGQIPQGAGELERFGGGVAGEERALAGDQFAGGSRQVGRPEPDALAELAKPQPHHALAQRDPVRERARIRGDDRHLPASVPRLDPR